MNGRFASDAMTAGEERLAGAGRAGQQHALGHLAAAVLEGLDAAQDPDRVLGVFEQVGLAAVVREAHPDLRVVRLDRVLPRSRQEPHDPGELEDAEGQREPELDGQRRRREQEREHRRDDHHRAVQRDEDREDQQDDEQPPEVLVPDERHVRAEATDPVHRKFTILLSATCTTRLMISGFPSAVFARMMISVAVRGPSFMVASVSTDVTPWMFHCCSSAASFS